MLNENISYNALKKRNHLCICCKRQDAYTLGGRSLCYDCAEKQRLAKRVYMRENAEKIHARKKKARERYVKEHRCVRCGKSLPDGYSLKTCKKCLERVKKFAEVFTAEREVKAMCDLIPSETWDNIESTFLEPCCGNGNFIVEIYARKLARCKDERDALKALASIVGIDIQADNVEESRKRLMTMFMEAFPNASEVSVLLAAGILRNNIMCGDSLEIMKKWENMTNDTEMH